MNKKLLSAAVLAGLAGTASAVNVNPDGLGQILLYPYYTTVGGKTTEIHVTNTTGDYKAVKVRFTEGLNSWEVRDFNLYLSPYDVWTAIIDVDKETGKPRFRSSDTSCTAPKMEPIQVIGEPEAYGGKEFSADFITMYGLGEGLSDELKLRGLPNDAPHRDTHPKTGEKLSQEEQIAMRIKEGYVEVIEMGVLDQKGSQYDAIRKAIKHTGEGWFEKTNTSRPHDCDFVREQFTSTDGLWAAATDLDLHRGFSAPKGGLMGSATISDLGKGTMMSYEPTAIENFYKRVVHARPGQSQPNLYGQGKVGKNADDTDRNGERFASNVSQVVHNNQVFSTAWNTASEALAAVLMAEGVKNEIYSFGDFGTTDWVVTFPNKHAFVNPNSNNIFVRKGVNINSGQYGMGKCTYNADGVLAGKPPFNQCFNVPLSFNTWDQEEFSTVIDPAELNWSPVLPTPGPEGLSLPWEVNVLQMSSKFENITGKDENGQNIIGEGSRTVFESYYGLDVPVKHTKGWLEVDFKDNSMEGNALIAGSTEDNFTNRLPDTKHRFGGYPVIGFAAVEIKNPTPNAENLLVRFASTYKHKYKRNISVVTVTGE